MICVLLLKLALQNGIRANFLGSFGECRLPLALRLLVSVVLFLLLTLLSDILALLNFKVPLLCNVLLLVFLLVFERGGHLVQEQRTAVTVTVRHELLVILVLIVLERHVHGRRGKVERETGLVGLLEEVPHVEAVRLRDEDDAGTRRREGTARVVRAEGHGRAEDRLVVVIESRLPKAEVEVMHSQDEVIEEGRALERERWTIIVLGVVREAHVLGRLDTVITLVDGLHAPIDEAKLTFVGSTPERGLLLVLLKEDAHKTQLSRTIKLLQLETQDRLEHVVGVLEHLSLIALPGVPEVGDTILRDSDEMSHLALAVLITGNIDRGRHELNVRNKVLVRGSDTGHAQTAHFNSCLRFFVTIIVGQSSGFVIIFTTGTVALLLGRLDTQLRAGCVPDDDLTVEATTEQHVGVLGMELNRRDLDRRLQNLVQRDNVRVAEVQHEHVALERLAGNLGTQLEVHVVNETHGDEVRLGRMELDATDALTLAVVVIDEGTRVHRGRVDLASLGGLLITEHFKIFLEHIDDFVRLKGGLDVVSDTLHELLKFLALLGLLLHRIVELLLLLFGQLLTRQRSQALLFFFVHEVLGIVLARLVDHSTEVRLRLNTFDLGCGLQTDIEHHPFVTGHIMDILGVRLDLIVVLLSLTLSE